MFFQEILRLIDNYRHKHRSSAPHSNVGPSQNRFRIPGFLQFHNPIRIPDLPSAITNTKAFKKLLQCTDWISSSLANTASMNAERIEEYITPEGTKWAPHAPGPSMAIKVHRIAAMAVFSVIYLPYSMMFSLIASLAAIGVRASFPRLWQFSLYLATVSWLPSLVLASIYLGGRWSIYQRRDQSWKIWSENALRRIKDFEGLHGAERSLQERRFFDWVRDGEGDGGWSFDELESYANARSDEESSIGVAIENDLWRSAIYSSDSGPQVSPSSPSEESTIIESSESLENMGNGIQMDGLDTVATRLHALSVPGASMEGFDRAELSSNRTLRTLPSIDGLATSEIAVADGAGTT